MRRVILITCTVAVAAVSCGGGSASSSAPTQHDLLVYRVGRGTGVLAGLNIGASFDQQFLEHMASMLAKREAQAATAAV